MTEPIAPQAVWVIMPILSGRDYTTAAIADVLDQSLPTRLLLINQGVDADFRDELERVAEAHADRVFLWSHHPPLPSLAATWNRALDFVWACGGSEALVVNNDVRLHRRTVEVLSLYLRDEQALFVSAVGVTADQFNPQEPSGIPSLPDGSRLASRGGPDFSCFLIAQDCHRRYRFDEAFTPAYGEDCSYHRELMLAGLGPRIFSVPLPYLHYASGTLKQVDPAVRRQLETQIEQISRAHYRQCWGGSVNAERYTIKGDPTSARDGVTNPDLQRWVAAGVSVPDAIVGGGGDNATPDSSDPS